MTTRLAAAVLVALAMLASRAVAAELPIFDAHIHYSQGDWDTISVARALDTLTAAGVTRALVSSTPDDGTLKLHDKAPARIVPFLRPYRNRGDIATWTRDASVATYVAERLKRGIYRGIGEFHMSAEDADTPVLRRFAALAEAQRLFFQAHVDAAAIERLLTLYPRVRMLWAHAGMSASAETVGTLLDRYPSLWVELALRGDVAPGGTLDPAWASLFVRHADRFMVGTDTWVTSRWSEIAPTMRDVRRWLGQLPTDVAEKIAYRNAERLFPTP